MRRYLFPVILGIVGVAILLSLGFWQVSRLHWKQAMLAEIQTHIDGAAQPLPARVDASMKYLPVTLAGRSTGQEILVLSGTRDSGGGYRVIEGFVTDAGRRIMVDRGFIPEGDRRKPRPGADLTVAGNLHFPQEAGSATPAPNLTEGIWFARDVPAMAAQLQTEPVLVVVRALKGDAQGITPQPISITGIPNNHLEYAWTWFMLAAVWAGMTAYLISRIRQRSY